MKKICEITSIRLNEIVPQMKLMSPRCKKIQLMDAYRFKVNRTIDWFCHCEYAVDPL